LSLKTRLFSENIRWMIYLGLGLGVLILSIILLILSIGYMQNGLVATSLLSALIGFTLLSGSLYILKLSAYVYSVSKTFEKERRGQ